MCVVGLTVLDAVSHVQSAIHALIIAPSDLFFIGSASMMFPLTSTNTMMYLFPLLNVAGNHPVWLLCIVMVALWIFI
jgi:hypothetical protein